MTPETAGNIIQPETVWLIPFLPVFSMPVYHLVFSQMWDPCNLRWSRDVLPWQAAIAASTSAAASIAATAILLLLSKLQNSTEWEQFTNEINNAMHYIKRLNSVFPRQCHTCIMNCSDSNASSAWFILRVQAIDIYCPSSAVFIARIHDLLMLSPLPIFPSRPCPWAVVMFSDFSLRSLILKRECVRWIDPLALTLRSSKASEKPKELVEVWGGTSSAAGLYIPQPHHLQEFNAQ